MPNYVKNIMKCSDLDMLDIFNKDEHGKLFIDFEKIIPMPKEI